MKNDGMSLYQYGAPQAVDGMEALEEGRREVERQFAVRKARKERGLPDLPPPSMEAGTGIVGCTLRVTLESSDNEYLTYPVEGFLMISETSMVGTITTAIFSRIDADGRVNGYGLVRNPVFTYVGL